MIHVIKAFQDSQDRSEKKERERLSLDKKMAMLEWENGAIKGESYRHELGFNKNPEEDLKACGRWGWCRQKPMEFSVNCDNKKIDDAIQTAFSNGVSYMTIDSDGIKEIHAERVIDNAFAFDKTAKDMIIEMIEKHYGSGKALEVADILKED